MEDFREVPGGPLREKDRQTALAIHKLLGKSLEEAEEFLLARSLLSRDSVAMNSKLAAELRT